MTEKEKIASKIKDRISSSENILIVCSRPVDPDSLGSGLTLNWWIKENYNKETDLVIFSSITEKLKHFPNLKDIDVSQVNNVNWEKYDLIILLDSSSWNLLLTNNYKSVLEKTGKDNLISIDHHSKDAFHSEVPLALRIDDICTAKIIYDYLIKDSKIKLNEDSATWMYYALIDDSRYFKNEMYPGIYSFAEDLIQAGARHDEVVNMSTDKDSMLFLSFGIENTEFYPELETTLLAIDSDKNEKLKEKFGENWRLKSIHKYYVEVFMRIIEGYNYGIMFEEALEGGVNTGWRTRNYGDNVSIQRVLEKIGFTAGGHFGAGGGQISNISIEEAKLKFIDEMSKALKNKDQYNL